MRACNKCGITLRGSDQEGDICLTCLSSLTPHCNFDQGYSTIEGCIRQTTKQPIEKPKPMKILPDQIDLCSFPFQDKGNWHNATILYFTDDTYTIHQYDDHYDISKEEADEYCDEHEQRIKEYAQFVHKTGTDPLRNYYVNRTETKKSEVKVQYGLYIGVEEQGLQVTQVEFEGVTYGRLEIHKLPSEVKDYLLIEYANCRYYLDGIQRKDLYDACYEVTDNSFKCMIEYEVDRPSDVIKKELIEITKL